MGRAWKQGWFAALATLGILATGAGFYWDALDAKAPWLIGAVSVLFFVVLFAAPGRSLLRWFIELRIRLKKGDKHDQIKHVAAEWQARAEDAEARLSDWASESVREGRRRVVGELEAAWAETTFGPGGMSLSDGTLVLGAHVTGGQSPMPGSIYLLRDVVLHDVKASLRCIGYGPSGAAFFKVDSQVSAAHIDHLTQLAETDSTMPAGLEIAPRLKTDNFANEG